MSAREELMQLRRQEPFQPFRVTVKGGETFDVLDPLDFLVGDVALVLTVHDPNDSDKDYPAFLNVGQVERIVAIDPPPANGRTRQPKRSHAGRTRPGVYYPGPAPSP